MAEKEEAQEKLLSRIHNDLTQRVAALKDGIQGYLQNRANQDELDAVIPDLMGIDTGSAIPNYLLHVQTSIKNGNLPLAPLMLLVDTPNSSVCSRFP